MPALSSRGPRPLSNVPASPLLYLGIDQSLVSTALTYVTEGAHVTERLACPFGADRPVQRLGWYHETVGNRLDALRPTLVGIEGYAFGAMSRAHALGELGGVIRLALLARNQRSVCIPPNTLKSFVTGNGNAEKAVMSKELFKRWGVDLDQNDEVDSAAIAIMTLAHHVDGLGMALNQKQRNDLTKVAPLDIVHVRSRLQPGANLLTKHPASSTVPLSATARFS